MLNNKIHPMKLISEKVDFIKQNFPEYKTCDPYIDFFFIEKIKRSMIESGLYRQKYAGQNPNINAAIINLIKRAQGKKITHRKYK